MLPASRHHVAMDLNAITENATRLGSRIQESLSEHTRALQQRDAYYDAADEKTLNVRKQLDSNSEREKLAAMKILIALTSKGRNMSEYFAPVIKNVASPNLELRKLVYIFLLRYAEQEPDLALLSINTFQKDLADPNPFMRAMALRVLSGIRVPMIANIVLMSIKRCAADISPYVRKVAALAIPKCLSLDPSLQESLVEVILGMWKDRSPLSIGSVVVAFDAVCPTRLDLLHKHFRRLCKSLVDVDEWGQVDLCNVLLRYARTMLARPKDDEELDEDVRLLLTSAEPLFFNRNPAVVIAATRVIFYAGPPSYHPKVVQPLLRLLHISPEVERIVLAYILASNPVLFASHPTPFFISAADLPENRACKLRILLAILNFDNHPTVLRELVEQEAVHEIGRCAQRVPECTDQCVTALLGMLDRGNDQAVVVLKNLVPEAVVDRLAGRLSVVSDPSARATIVWLSGQYAEGTSAVDGLAPHAADVLRQMAKTFPTEARAVKLQVVTMAAKLVVLSQDPRVGLLSQYVMQMARYDVDWDVRDRTRMLVGLLAGLDPAATTEREGVILRRAQVKVVLFNGKQSVVEVDEPGAFWFCESDTMLMLL